MSSNKEGIALVGVGAAACAACCAGPILGFLAAIGLGTAAGIAVFGAAGVVVAVIGLLFVLRRRRSRAVACEAPRPVDVAIGSRRN